MRKPVSSAALDFSYSRMGMYLECPRKYEFRYIQRLPEKPKPYFALGQGVHDALEYLYAVQAPPFPSMEAVLQRFRDEWEKTSPEAKGYSARQLQQGKHKQDFDDGLVMLGAYYRKHRDVLHIPLAVEFRAKVEVDGLNVIMIADRLDYLGNGKIAVVDYKTGKNVERAPDQLYMYQKLLDISPDFQKLAAAKTGEDGPFSVGKMVFCHVPSLEEAAFDRAGDQELGAVWNKALDVAAKIRAREFLPSPGETKCRFCDYRERCQAGSAQTAPEEAAFSLPAKPAGDILGEKIDKCGRLREEADALGREITALMREKGLNLHFGAKYKAALEKSPRLEIPDEKAMLSALRETGLLNRALLPTKKAVENLLSAPDLPPDQRARLESCVRRGENLNLGLNKIKD
ncbi:MAG: PD-(D/E)XK nuclease family protein [Elusimicrobiales bacterium]